LVFAPTITYLMNYFDIAHYEYLEEAWLMNPKLCLLLNTQATATRILKCQKRYGNRAWRSTNWPNF